MQTHPIGVKCPRCAEDIECTVEVKRVPGKGGSATTDMRLVDLAERFAEHYREAGHTPQDVQPVAYKQAVDILTLSA